MRIGFDVDGVLVDFNTGFIDKCIELTGEDRFPARPFDIPVWNYPEHYGYTREQTSQVWEYIKQSETFWSLLPRYEWTRDVLERLHTLQYAGHDIYFTTARPGVYAKHQTEDWLHWQGYDRPTVLITDKKGFAALTLNLDTYIDDKDSNCEDVAKVINNERFIRGQESGPGIYMLAQPWNADSGFGGYARCGCKRIDNPLIMLDELAGKLS